MKKSIPVLILLTLTACAAPPRAPSSPSVPIPLPPPKNEPNSFTGLSAAQVRALAGMPAFTRKDGATEMWRYDTRACRAFFFLTGTPAKVTHVETLPRTKDNQADQACLNALRAPSS